jgi:hypothetical protein
MNTATWGGGWVVMAGQDGGGRPATVHEKRSRHRHLPAASHSPWHRTCHASQRASPRVATAVGLVNAAAQVQLPVPHGATGPSRRTGPPPSSGLRVRRERSNSSAGCGAAAQPGPPAAPRRSPPRPRAVTTISLPDRARAMNGTWSSLGAFGRRTAPPSSRRWATEAWEPPSVLDGEGDTRGACGAP